MRGLLGLIVCFVLAGCSHAADNQVSPPPPPVAPTQLSQQELCAQLLGALGSPYIDPTLKQAALEKARNRGCLQ